MIRELKIAIIQSKNVFKGEITVKFWLVPLQNFNLKSHSQGPTISITKYVYTCISMFLNCLNCDLPPQYAIRGLSK